MSNVDWTKQPGQGYDPGGYGQASGAGYGMAQQPNYTPQTPSAMPAGAVSGQGAGPIPATNMGWAVASLLFFWPLAFSAFTNAGNVTRLWMMGDYWGAQEASEKAKKFGKISLGIFVGLFVLYILFYVILIVAVLGAAGRASSYGNGFFPL